MVRWGWSGVWGVQLVLTAHRLWLNCFSFSHLTFSPILSKFFLILACGSPSLWVMHHLYYRMGCLTEPMMSSRYVIVTSSAYKGRAKGSLLESCSFSPFISFSWLAFSTVRLFFFHCLFLFRRHCSWVYPCCFLHLSNPQTCRGSGWRQGAAAGGWTISDPLFTFS